MRREREREKEREKKIEREEAMYLPDLLEAVCSKDVKAGVL